MHDLTTTPIKIVFQLRSFDTNADGTLFLWVLAYKTQRASLLFIFLAFVPRSSFHSPLPLPLSPSLTLSSLLLMILFLH